MLCEGTVVGIRHDWKYNATCTYQGEGACRGKCIGMKGHEHPVHICQSCPETDSDQAAAVDSDMKVPNVHVRYESRLLMTASAPSCIDCDPAMKARDVEVGLYEGAERSRQI